MLIVLTQAVTKRNRIEVRQRRNQRERQRQRERDTDRQIGRETKSYI